MKAELRLRGLRAGNLRDLDLDLPLHRWTALHGPSGAGKSALLFGVLEPVSRRRFRILEDPRALPAGREDWLRPLAEAVEGLQPVVAWAGEIPRRRRDVEIGTALDLWTTLARAWKEAGERLCPDCGHAFRPPDLEALEAELRSRLAAGVPVHVLAGCGGEPAAELLRAGWTRVRPAPGAPLERLEELEGRLPPEALLLLDRFRWGEGREARLREALAEGLRRRRGLCVEAGESVLQVPAPDRCPACAAALPARPPEELPGLREAPDLRLGGRPWEAWCTAPLETWRSLPEGALRRSRRTLDHLLRTGLGHLAAGRRLGTLSLGEARRLELVARLGAVRRDQLLLFDEPGMGLHGEERRDLAALLQEIRAQGNTVLTADPAREFLEAADAWVLLGPGGGPEGGRLVARGSPSRLPRRARPAPREARPPAPEARLVFQGLGARFLDIPRLELPLGRLVALCGVSGSGKTTLLEEELVPRLREGRGFRGAVPAGGVRVLLERALGSARRSSIATLAGVWTELREAFAAGEEARIRGLGPGDFVAAPGRGACPDCRGSGAGPAGEACSRCRGLGLRPDLLELRLRGRSLALWLTTPLERLEKRLPASGRMRRVVRHLLDLGLGPRSLGERGRHLSLGERGRIALARALASARSGRPLLFLLDEPCLGLPVEEADRVVGLLRRLTEEGHSFWVVEHHEVLLRGADWLVELGPGPGPRGGRLLHAGPPEAVVGRDTPTGRWLAAPSRSGGRRRRRPRPAPLRSEVLPEDGRREGRRRLETELLRELATRSPLIADLWSPEDLAAGAGLEEALPPTAWPLPARPEAPLDRVLGLAETLEALLEEAGEDRCARCGGPGPWRGLEEALPSREADGAASHLDEASSWIVTCPWRLEDPERAPALLAAAGFRTLLRRGERLRLDRAGGLEAEDEVWLDRLPPEERLEPGRLRDLQHHARLLGAGELRFRVRPGDRPWVFRPGACRACGQGSLEVPAPVERRLRGENLGALRRRGLGSLLAFLEEGGAVPARLAEAGRLLAGTSLLGRPLETPAGRLTDLEAGLARRAGLVLVPVPGVVLLHDQPLAGLPPRAARALGEALLERGLHRFTDPEGWFAPAEPAPPLDPEAAAALPREPFSLDLDPRAWGEPPPAGEERRLREALGIEPLLRERFLRTEEARLRGWTAADLSRGPGGRLCPRCRGQGGLRPHPELRLPCPLCGGSGWGRECAALEERGLRWTELGGMRVAEAAAALAGSGALEAVLRTAEALGLGAFALDEELRRLPRGTAVLAPLAFHLVRGPAEEALRLFAPAAGLAPLEAARLLSRMHGYLCSAPAPVWREHHPLLQGA